MATVIKNKKGFKVIKMKVKELEDVLNFPVELGFCDSCNKKQTEIYYVAVLNWSLCEKCFHAWLNRAKHYKEDFEFEKICLIIT